MHKSDDYLLQCIIVYNSVSSLTERKSQSFPPDTSDYNYLILEEKLNCFTMQSDPPSYRYIRLYISVNNSIKRMYHCVLEREYILFGLELNNLPPEFVIPLEHYEISEEMGNVIKLVNKRIEIAMQFESESECKYWRNCLKNAKASIYSYIPVRLQEKGNNSQTRSVSHSPPIVIEPPALPPKLSNSNILDVQIGGISRVHSSPSSLSEYDKLFPKESNFEIASKSDTSRLVRDSAFSFPVSSLDNIKSKPLPQIPVAENSPPHIQQYTHEDDVFIQSYDQRITENTKFVLSDSHDFKSRAYESIEVESVSTLETPEHPRYKNLDVPRKILSKGVPGIPLKEKAKNVFKLPKANVQTTDGKKSKPRVVYVPNL